MLKEIASSSLTNRFFLSFFFSLLLGIGILFVGLIVRDISQSEKFNLRLLEKQIRLILHKQEDRRLVGSFIQIQNDVWQLELVEKVVLLNKSCEVLSKKPMNSRFIYSCSGSAKVGDWYFFKINDIVSELQYIGVKTSNKMYGHIREMLFSALVFIFIFSILISVVFMFIAKRTIGTPVRKLQELVDELASLSTEKIDPDPKFLPKEIRPLYTSLINAKKENEDLNKQVIQKTRYEVIAEVSSQVAHDIKSPLSALEVVSCNLSVLPEKTRNLLQAAIARIKNIANDLGQKGKELKSQEKNKTIHIASSIEGIVSEKQAQLVWQNNISIVENWSDGSLDLFSDILLEDFQRVLSNILNNSLEAIESSGVIRVILSKVGNSALVEISDNGKGIDSEHLPRLWCKGATFGKEGGTGLGLYHAKKTVEIVGGNIEIESAPGVGTKVVITLPTVVPPAWFVSEIDLTNKKSVVILDDDPSIHGAWDRTLSKIEKFVDFEILHFSYADELKKWTKLNKITSQTIFLIDYEFAGRDYNGLDIISDLGISKWSLLVTSRNDDLGLQNACINAGVRILPKMGVSGVSLRV